MTNRNDDEDVFCKGAWGEVRFAISATGERLAKTYLTGLTDGEYAKLAALFKRMADFGRIENKQKFRKEDGEIFAFKSFQDRIPCFQLGTAWYLTHGFRKKGNKWPPSEIIRAKRIRKEHLEGGEGDD